MNANDLIHVLENSNNTEPFLFKQAATMLRQQQAEIEALKNKIVSLEFLARKEK